MTVLTGTARFITRMPEFLGDARLYEVNPPVTYRDFDNYDYESDELPPLATANYVVVSGCDTFDHGPETYMFPARRDGDEAKVIDWIELDGSFEGEIDHARALRAAGYEVI